MQQGTDRQLTFTYNCTLVLEALLADGETVWNTNPLVVAEAFGVLDVREERRERVVLLCFRNEPLKD